jgi:hypothetical protein
MACVYVRVRMFQTPHYTASSSGGASTTAAVFCDALVAPVLECLGKVRVGRTTATCICSAQGCSVGAAGDAGGGACVPPCVLVAPQCWSAVLQNGAGTTTTTCVWRTERGLGRVLSLLCWWLHSAEVPRHGMGGVRRYGGAGGTVTTPGRTTCHTWMWDW